MCLSQVYFTNKLLLEHWYMNVPVMYGCMGYGLCRVCSRCVAFADFLKSLLPSYSAVYLMELELLKMDGGASELSQ